MDVCWRHEFVNRPQYGDFRRLLKDEAAQRGGIVHLFRKGENFRLWLKQRSPDLLYAIISDWRAAPSCCNVLEEFSTAPQPKEFIVICDSTAQLNKACGWASSEIPTRYHVQVAERENIPASFCQGLARNCFSLLNRHCGGIPPTWDALRVEIQADIAEQDRVGFLCTGSSIG